MSKATESMFDGKDVLIPLAEVSYILKFPSCIEVHFKGSAESVTLVQPDQNALISAWCRYRSEVEADTLMDLDGAQPAPSILDTHNDMVVGLDYQGAMSCARQRAKKEAGLLYPEGDARKEEKERELASEYYRQYSEWRAESATWAAAWKAAKRHEGNFAQPTPSVPVDLITDYLVSISAHVAHQDDPKAQAEIGELLRMLAAAPVVNGGWKLVPIEPMPSMPKLHVGYLPTLNQDGYPALGTWWVQLWDGDDVFARVYGSSPEEAHNRAEMLAAAPESKP